VEIKLACAQFLLKSREDWLKRMRAARSHLLEAALGSCASLEVDRRVSAIDLEVGAARSEKRSRSPSDCGLSRSPLAMFCSSLVLVRSHYGERVVF
jgi:hypothetical protein